MIKLNGIEITPTTFPDRTSQVWQLSSWPPYSGKITWEFTHEGEFMHLAQLVELLRARTELPVYLHLPYLPYGRQDKEVDNGATFALHAFARLINALGFTRVDIGDPHSPVALELIERSRAYYPRQAVELTLGKTQSDLIVYPDQGALRKYTRIYAGVDVGYLWGEKVRDQATGRILSYRLSGGPSVLGRRCLIVDDICDGGATFILLAQALREQGVDSVSLFVTHGLFTQGVRRLFDAGIDRVFTAEGEVPQRAHTPQPV